MTAKKTSASSLPEAELDVLSCLLQQPGRTAREVRESLAQTRPMAHASVVTLLSRLEKKRLVRKAKGTQGKAFVYEATQEPGRVYRSLVGGMLDRVFGGNGMALVHSLFEAQPPDADQIEQLQTMLDAMKAKKAQGASHE